MNYIIDPMWFYLVGIVDKLVTVFGAIGGFLALISAACALFVMINIILEGDPKDYKICKKVLKIFLPFSIVFILLAVFIPSKETLIEMQIAKLATYENAELTIDSIKGLVDYIVEAIKSV